MENHIPILETENQPQPGTFRGKGFYIVGNRMLEFPKLEIDFSVEFLRKLGKPVSGVGNSKT